MSSHGSGVTADTPWLKKVLLVWTPSGATIFREWIDGFALESIAMSAVGMLLLVWAVSATDPHGLLAVVYVLVFFSPIGLAVAGFIIFWRTWIHYVRFVFFFNTPMILLHIELPPEIQKSPLAMEIFLASLWSTGNETTFIDRFWLGRSRPQWSLELVSNEGRIGYYIHLRKNMKDIVEAKLYGQFPEARVTEVEDYVKQVNFNLDEYDMWCGEYKKMKTEAIPIRTYVDYGLDQNPDTPETKTDPLTNVLELLSSRGPGEYLWIQFVIRANAKVDWYGIQTGHDSFETTAKEEIRKITEGAIKRAQELTQDDAEKKKVGTRGATLLTQGERNLVEAIERQLGKQIFQCGVRCLYIGKKESFRGITGAATFRLFDSFRGGSTHNELRGTRGMVGFDYPWESLFGRKEKTKRNFFFQYKYRAYFNVPYDQVPACLSTEELASLWHFPGSWVQTPGLQRVPAKVSQAPGNLPVGPANLPR